MTNRQRVTAILAPIVLGVAFLALWQWFVVARDIKPFLLPKPTAIWTEMVDFKDRIWEATKVTGFNALWGLVVGTVAGTAVALIANRFRWFGEMIGPMSAAANAIPIVALVTVFARMLDQTTETPRRLVIAVVAFFPIFVNVLRGLSQVEPVHLELMQSYAASKSAVSRLVRFPNALPFLLTGVRVSSSLCVIAAIVSEYFAGQQNGLGSKITGYAKSSNYPRAWAFVVASCVLGLVFYVAALLLERLAMPWKRRRST